jgi:N-acetylmuramoyl-L-alanine amidase
MARIISTIVLLLAMMACLPLSAQGLMTVRHIVIDPGHGGEDLGTEGHGVLEKDLVLELSMQLADALRASYPTVMVTLTRTGDDYPTLEERTHLANTLEADLFISVHANAAPNLLAHGIETFYLAPQGTAPGEPTPGQEELGPTRLLSEIGVVGDLHALIVEDLRREGAMRGSAGLATTVQNSLIETTGAMDRGVRTGQFRVLRGARMPAIVVETGFLSNEDEGERLLSEEYQTSLIQGLVLAVGRYDRGCEAVASQWQLSAGRLAMGE